MVHEMMMRTRLLAEAMRRLGRGCGLFAWALTVWVVFAGGSAFASDGRAYELVSPSYKAGYGVWGMEAVAPNGESAAFSSFGAFSGDPSDTILTNAYVARRGDAGWRTVPLSPPASVWPLGSIRDYSVDLSLSLVYGQRSPNVGATTSIREAEFLTHDTALPDVASSFDVIWDAVKPIHEKNAEFVAWYDTATPDLSHIVFETAPGEELLREAEGSQSRIYDLSQSGLHLIDLNNKNKPISMICRVATPGNALGRLSLLNAVSSDGSEIFFESGVSSEDPNACVPHEQVFVRLGASRTVEISRPFDPLAKFGGCVGEVKKTAGEVPCLGAGVRGPAEFEGASEDGSRVFFITSEALTATDTDAGDDVYMARIECPGGGLSSCEPPKREVTGLTQVSRGAEPATVQEVVAIIQDGSRVYFVAKGVLSGPNADGRMPVKNAYNLYVEETGSSGGPDFIGELCAGAETSGAVYDPACPASATANDKSSLWEVSTRPAQTNECSQKAPTCQEGRYFTFLTYAQLTADDTDEGADVYRYDSVTHALTRVSIGEQGYDANGNGSGNAIMAIASESDATGRQHGLNSRAISEDGSHIVFSTSEPLSPLAVNGMENVYEWSKGSDESGGDVALISTGNSEGNSFAPIISSSGRDVFFLTVQSLVAEDTDEQLDVYDARVNGGFPGRPVEREPCSADACQGPLSSPTPVLMPPSETQAPGENYGSRVPKRHRKSHAKHPRKRTNRHKHGKSKRKVLDR